MRRLSLVAKNTLFVGVLVVITAGTVSWAGYENARAIMDHQIKNRLAVVANDRRTILLNALHAQEQAARALAASTRVRELVAHRAACGVTEARAVLAEARAASEAVLEITLVDAAGKVVASTVPARAGEDVSRSPAYVAGRTGTRVSPPVAADGEYHALLSCPVRGPSGAIAGVLLASLDMTGTMDALADTTGLGETGEVLIATRSGDRVSHVLLSRAGDAIADAPLERSPAIALALAGREGTLELVDYRGNATIAAYRPIGYPGWAIAVKIDRAEADAPVAALRARVLWLDARILIAALVFSYLLAARTTRPVLELAATAKAVSAGDRQARVPVRSDDEIGQLAQAFNDMSDKLAASYATLEERVAARTRELARSNAELEQFAYVASHDLQEPLRMVSSYTQLLARRYQGRLDADADEFIGYAVDGAKAMQRLIADLLTYSKLGRQEIVRERVDMRAVVDSALANLRTAVSESDARVTIGALPEVQADPHQLVPLFQNLIGNAIKYAGDAPPDVTIEAAPEPDAWRFTVRDRGIGLEPQFAERIFVIFQRLHTRAEYPGTGIGLAICKKIVERHGGRIWVEAAPGEGAAFHFTIPKDA